MQLLDKLFNLINFMNYYVAWVRPETQWATHGQDERGVTTTGGPDALLLQK